MTDSSFVVIEAQANAVQGMVVRIQPDQTFPYIHYLLIFKINF